MQSKRLSYPQYALLKAFQEEKYEDYYCTFVAYRPKGKAESFYRLAIDRTWSSLQRRGFINESNEITEAGLAALKEY